MSVCQVAFDPLDGSSIIGANWAVSAVQRVHASPSLWHAHAALTLFNGCEGR